MRTTYLITAVEDVEDGWLLGVEGATFVACPSYLCRVRPAVGEVMVVQDGAITIGDRVYRSLDVAGVT